MGEMSNNACNFDALDTEPIRHSPADGRHRPVADLGRRADKRLFCAVARAMAVRVETTV